MYRICTKVMSILKGTHGGGEPKNVIIGWVQKRYLLLRDSKLLGFMYRRIGPTMDIYAKIWGYFSPGYRVCTKAKFILKRSYGSGEPKNVIIGWVQNPYLPLLHSKLPGFMHRCIGPTMEKCQNSGLPFEEVPCLHQKMFVLKGSYGGGEHKNVIIGWVQKRYLPLRDSKLPGFVQRRIGLTIETCRTSRLLFE